MRCVGALARELQSPRIAYGPDQGSPTFDVLLDAVLDGQCFDDVVLRLRPDWIVEAAD
jgi:hypothetical protein